MRKVKLWKITVNTMEWYNLARIFKLKMRMYIHIYKSRPDFKCSYVCHSLTGIGYIIVLDKTQYNVCENRRIICELRNMSH